MLAFGHPGCFFVCVNSFIFSKALEQEESEDYGEDGALWPLKDKCISAKTGGYEYRVCPFKDAHQEEGKSKVCIWWFGGGGFPSHRAYGGFVVVFLFSVPSCLWRFYGGFFLFRSISFVAALWWFFLFSVPSCW